MGTRRFRIAQSIPIAASTESVWNQVTQLDIAAFRHPLYLSALGIPKPLRAEVLRGGVGGARVAHFSNNLRFAQEITDWKPGERFAFTFKPDPGFRVAYLLDLSDGPFRITAGAYDLAPSANGTHLTLSSTYDLHGVFGAILRWPVRLVLYLFQAYLLRGIRANAERSQA